MSYRELKQELRTVAETLAVAIVDGTVDPATVRDRMGLSLTAVKNLDARRIMLDDAVAQNHTMVRILQAQKDAEVLERASQFEALAA